MPVVVESLVNVEDREIPSLENYACVCERARGMLETEKFCGVLFFGIDEMTLQVCLKHLRATHPKKYGESRSMR